MLAAVIKNKLQISEVIITIMLNYVALYLVEYLVNNPFKSEGMVVRTEEIQDSARLVSLVAHTRLNTGIFIALLAVFLFWVLFYKTKLGYEMRATGDSPFAAESAGINNKKNLLAAMFISGALAGIGGACEVMGVQGYYISGMTTGYGFSGIAIAVMGHNQPLGTLASALLFGALNAGASSMNRMTDIPGEFISVLQALIILFISTPGIVIANSKSVQKKEGGDIMSGQILSLLAGMVRVAIPISFAAWPVCCQSGPESSIWGWRASCSSEASSQWWAPM